MPPPPVLPTPKFEDLDSKFYKVNFEYLNPDNEPDTLTLHVGDILIVLETREDGWWRGQSGDSVGLFPVAYCESITEEEVKQFISANASKGRRKQGGSVGAPGDKGRAELEKEMKDLKEEETELAHQITKLKEEVAAMKEDAKKKRKATREELLESFDTLPPSLFNIPSFQNLQHDLVRNSLLVGRILDADAAHNEILPSAIEAMSALVSDSSKTEPKLKPDLDKVISKILALQKYFIDDISNLNADLQRKVVERMDTLFAQIDAFTRGDIDLANVSINSPATSPSATPASPLAISSSPNTTTSPTDAEHPDPADEEAPLSSPRDKKKKKKKDRAVEEEPIVEETPATDPTPAEGEKKKKKKKRDTDEVREPAHDSEATPVAEEATPDGSEKKHKKKKHRHDEETQNGAEADSATPTESVPEDEPAPSSEKKKKKKKKDVEAEE